MSTATRITELIAGRLYRISGLLPLDGSISWAAPADGVEAVSMYALKSDEGVLLVDSCLPVHREGVLEAVRSIAGDAAISIVVTRIEPDTLGNLYFLLTQLPVKEVAAVPPAPNPFDFENAFPMSTKLPADVQEKLRRLPSGATHSICGFELEAIRGPLRILATAWLYLEAEGVLFTSDAFGYSKLASADDPGILESPLSEEGLAEVERHAAAKFGWLAEADAQTVLDQTQAVFDARSVRVVAPTHGKVLWGADVVSSYLDGLRSLYPSPASTPGAR